MMAAAQRLFRERGYGGTTVESIAVAAGVSERTFYRYFGSKDGVLAARGSDVIASAAAGLAPEARIEHIIRRLVGELATSVDGESPALVFRLLRRDPQMHGRVASWRRQWREQLAWNLAERAGRRQPSMADRVRSMTAIEATGLALDEWSLRRPDHELDAVVDEIIAILHEELGDHS